MQEPNEDSGVKLTPELATAIEAEISAASQGKGPLLRKSTEELLQTWLRESKVDDDTAGADDSGLPPLKTGDNLPRHLNSRILEQAAYDVSLPTRLTASTKAILGAWIRQAQLDNAQDPWEKRDSTGDEEVNLVGARRAELSPERQRLLAVLERNHLNFAGSELPSVHAEERESDAKDLWHRAETRLLAKPELIDQLGRLLERGGLLTLTAQTSDGSYRFCEVAPQSPESTRGERLKPREDFLGKVKEVEASYGAQLVDKDLYAELNRNLPENARLDSGSYVYLGGDLMGSRGQTYPLQVSSRVGIRLFMDV